MTTQEIIAQACLPELLQSSRIHKVNSYFNHENVYMKRDDELGLGIGGSKARKFASLLFKICQQNPELVIVEGSLNSNNVLGITALLNSYGFNIALALPKSHSPNIGNALWVSQLVEKNQIIEIGSIQEETREYYEESFGVENIFIIREGACQIESIPGLLTLGQEILDFEQSDKIEFDNLFIDSGTGITAISTYIAMELHNRLPNYFITLIAGSSDYFFDTAESMIHRFNRLYDQNISLKMDKFTFLLSPTAKSFGSINTSIKKEWKQIMHKLGFPIDLTYTAKHLYTIKNNLSNLDNLSKNLVVNCGSWLSARNHEHFFTE